MSTDSTIERRTLVKGAVWAVPAVALAFAAPAAAASAAQPVSLQLTNLVADTTGGVSRGEAWNLVSTVTLSGAGVIASPSTVTIRFTLGQTNTSIFSLGTAVLSVPDGWTLTFTSGSTQLTRTGFIPGAASIPTITITRAASGGAGNGNKTVYAQVTTTAANATITTGSRSDNLQYTGG